MTGDHHLWRKSYPYEASARIPFLVWWPYRMGFKATCGKALPHPVELRDVLPTLLDVAGAPIPEWLDGRSVLSLLRGETQTWRDVIDLEHDICYGPQNHWNALTDGKMKYIFHAFDGTEQRFDLDRDPREIHDLAGQAEHAPVLAMWRERLIAHLSERGERFVRDGGLVRRPESLLYSPEYPGS